MGPFLLMAPGIGLGTYIVVYKFVHRVHRQRVPRELRITPITADELKDLLDNGQAVFVVELRGKLDREADPDTIPGALRM